MRWVLLSIGLGGCIETELEAVKPDTIEGVRTLEVDPGLVDFGLRSSSAPVTDVVTLTSTGDLPVTVSTIDLSGSTAYTLTWASDTLVLEPTESAEVVVTYTPASYDDDGQMVVRSDASEPEQVVELLGAGLYPAIDIAPASLYFESEYGESVREDFIVYSIGTADLDISDMYVQGAQFTAEGGVPDILAPGESATVTVTYTPEVEGETATGKVWLTTNTPLGYAIVPLEAQPYYPCLGLGEAWDRGLLEAYTEFDGLTLHVGNLSDTEEVCIDNWYVWISTESQDLGAGDMDADFGDVYPTGSLTIAPGDYLQFDAGADGGSSWWCMELYQYTQPNKNYDFIGARVPEPMLTSMLGANQDDVWAFQEDHPVMIAARETNYLSVGEGGGTGEVTIRALNMGSAAGDVEIRETIPAEYTADGFSIAPSRTENGADGATVYVFDARLAAREIHGEYEQVSYDEAVITYTLHVPACRGRQYLPVLETRWDDSDDTARTATANPLVVNCD